MSRQVLTLKYRPQSFDELWAQEHVKTTLKRAIENNRLANAYLFAGPRGVGKTTTARILAKSLNCEQGPTVTPCNKCSYCVEITASRSMDVIELDGASNRGIDQIRELRENIKYAPSSGRFKVYIIDEVHMLTKEAFNALLKTLEEPPAHAKFVFATTAAHDVPTTIVSRCQRFDFRKATPAEIGDRLRWIAGREQIRASDAALVAIARRADGAIRDAESILDQMAAYSPAGVELADVEELLGIVPAARFFDYADLLAAGDAAGLLRFLDAVFASGYDHIEFYSGLVQHFRNLLLLDVSGSAAGLGLLSDEAGRLAAQARTFGRERILGVLSELTKSEQSARNTQLPRVLLEVLSLELIAGAVPSARPAAGPDAVADRGSSAAAVWAELRLNVNQHKPMLAAMLETATAETLSDDTLTISFPARQKVAEEAVAAELARLSQALSQVLGRPARVTLAAARHKPVDQSKDKLARVFGRVEEEHDR
jgi:DNA polymerase-3 subunit gamma/tau